MKDITMFMKADCPFCKEAFDYMEELYKKDPSYREIKVTVIDEVKEEELAAKYDYYYVPTFYVGDVKAHEGMITLEDVERVFSEARA